jgi:hypothetical protein
MGYLLAGLSGVVVGGVVLVLGVLFLFQKKADRDLIERRMRALMSYRDYLGDPERWFLGESLPAPAEAEQLLKNVLALSREYGLTAWLFDEPLRAKLGHYVAEVVRTSRRCLAKAISQENSQGIMPVLFASRRLERELRMAVLTTLREHRRFRFLPELHAGHEGGSEIESEVASLTVGKE